MNAISRSQLLLERGRSRGCQEDYISPTLVMRAGANSHSCQ
jgi:hypothetical protein